MTPRPATEWILPVAAPLLGPAEAHVWKAQLPAPGEEATEGIHLLDVGERDRADRFHFAEHRRQYIFSHVVLRTVLAHYAGLPPAQLRFATKAAGKPVLDGVNARGLEFNLSHSGRMTLVAVSGSSAVGVDVEEWSANVEVDDLAKHFFSTGECLALGQLSHEAGRRAFFACWSRKEAYIKATGLGVTAGLDYFDVVVDPAGPARLLADRRHPAATRSWQLTDLDVGAGFAAAIATSSGSTVRCFLFDQPAHRPLLGASW